MTTSYCRRDLRAVDFLAMLLFGSGFVGAIGVVLLTPRAPVLAWMFVAGLLWVGLVLHFKVRQLAANGGREPVKFENVPE